MPFYSSDNRVVAIMQYVILWVSLFVMLALFILLFRADFKVPQKTVTVKIDVRNKVNVCLPDDPDLSHQDLSF
jgi:hypothetical protein